MLTFSLFISDIIAHVHSGVLCFLSKFRGRPYLRNFSDFSVSDLYAFSALRCAMLFRDYNIRILKRMTKDMD